ncbi:hypothetical protein EVAR_999_1 [Eumeta japonica]|uniref:Uncharacterized protein n=1 Tax=Eumeta variegata TaxID=151549 RepID=A0A4C1SH75_EUMVA|nr:hypothetical protein EVAR_999_1 [Eumeta japonica]
MLTDRHTADRAEVGGLRFSKRQARAPEYMNNVGSYRDPLLYNEWPVYPAVARAAPRFRYQYPAVTREAYGRVVTKAPPNVVRAPDYDEMYGMLTVPHSPGKILRYPGPSRSRVGSPFIPPQRDRFEALKKLIRQEHVRELARKYEAEQKQEFKDIASGKRKAELQKNEPETCSNVDDYIYGSYGDDARAQVAPPMPLEYAADEPTARHRKPPSGSRQVNQFSRYSDVMTPNRRDGPAQAHGDYTSEHPAPQNYYTDHAQSYY